jgi:hypothetical protein
MADQISIDDFRVLSPQWLNVLEKKGFWRSQALEEVTPSTATLVYSGKHLAFVFSFDVRDQCVDAEVVKVIDGNLVEYSEGGYSADIYNHLVQHEGYRGGPKGRDWELCERTSSGLLERSIKGWINLIETVGTRLLMDREIRRNPRNLG